MNMVGFDNLALRLTGTRFTLVSDVVQDQTSGKYVRTLQFFTVAPETVNARPDLTITLSGDTALDVELQTPKLNF
jgi:hypothetical protein